MGARATVSVSIGLGPARTGVALGADREASQAEAVKARQHAQSRNHILEPGAGSARALDHRPGAAAFTASETGKSG